MKQTQQQMKRTVRLLVALVRPPVLVLFALATATGLAETGHGQDHVVLGKALVAVIAYMLFSVLLNDIADESIDRVNLPGDRHRPLVTGAASPAELVALAPICAAVALGAGLLLSPLTMLVIGGGLALSAAYSLPPVRLAARGALASLLLPGGYVAVPYLVGVLAVRRGPTDGDLLLLVALYVGFIGRILLKDFRDVRGDALFGKRTFLLRHGRRQTCALSAACTATAAVTLAAVRHWPPTVMAADAIYTAVVLGLLWTLARNRRRDDAVISSIAIVSRGLLVTVLAQLSMTHWTPLAAGSVVLALMVLTLGQAHAMVRRADQHAPAAIAGEHPRDESRAPGRRHRRSCPAIWNAPAARVGGGGRAVRPCAVSGGILPRGLPLPARHTADRTARLGRRCGGAIGPRVNGEGRAARR